MFCGSCGTQIKEGAKFCPGCGQPVKAEPVQADTVAVEPVVVETPPPKTNTTRRIIIAVAAVAVVVIIIAIAINGNKNTPSVAAPVFTTPPASTETAPTNSRTYIKKSIGEWRQCRNVAITKTNGDVALYGRNGSAYMNVPAGLDEKLTQMNKENQYIDDVQLTEDGRWLIVGDMIYWDRIGTDLETKIRELIQDGDHIISVTFNDYGDWIVISDKHYDSSSTEITNWLINGASKYGFLHGACITDDGMIAVFDKGFAYRGDVPMDCWNALDKTDLVIRRLKISGTAWFFADENGNYEYNM